MNNKTAIVYGATGMIGNYLVEELIQNMRYTAIKVFTRKSLNIQHIKIIEHVVDVEDIASYKDMIKGDDLFICLGTTRRKAGSTRRYEEIDRDLPVNIVRASSERGVRRVAVISSLGANSKSGNSYSRIKGEMEEGIFGTGTETTVILRPSLLLGKREEFRFFEKLATILARPMSFILSGKLKIYRAIHGRDVALAMIELIASTTGKKIVLSHDLQSIADKKKEKADPGKA